MHRFIELFEIKMIHNKNCSSRINNFNKINMYFNDITYLKF